MSKKWEPLSFCVSPQAAKYPEPALYLCQSRFFVPNYGVTWMVGMLISLLTSQEKKNGGLSKWRATANLSGDYLLLDYADRTMSQSENCKQEQGGNE